MAIKQPQSSDYLDSPDHAKSHRVIAIDDASSDQALTVDVNNDVQSVGNMNIATGKKFKINNVDLGASDVGAISEVLDDTTPQLGGDLDCNGNKLTGSSVITGQTEKTNPVDDDTILIADSESVGNLKELKIVNLPSSVKQTAYNNALAQSSHTGDTLYTQKVRLTFTPTALKTFRISASFLMAIDTKNNFVKARAQLDDTTTIMEHNMYLAESYANASWILATGVAYASLSAVSHNIDLDFGVVNALRTVYAKEAYVIVDEL